MQTEGKNSNVHTSSEISWISRLMVTFLLVTRFLKYHQYFTPAMNSLLSSD